MISWVRVLYNNSLSRIINSGHLSQSFLLSRGVRQGCPLSPYLFLLVIETLAIKIRNNINIKGLSNYGLESKISLYADDTIFFLTPKKNHLNALLKDLDQFAELSGLRPNYDKCIILRLGSLHGTTFKLPCNSTLVWSDGPIDILGIHIPKRIDELVKINIENKLQKMKKVLGPWKSTTLSLFGKVTLVNSLCTSQFTYLLMSLPSPNEIFYKKYDELVFNFIWNNKPEKIKRKYLYNSLDEGGVKLINLKALNLSLKASWVQKIYCNPNWSSSCFLSNIHPIFKYNLFMFAQISNTHFQCLQNIFENLSPFFKDMIQAWLHFQYFPPESVDAILQQMIWFNSNILINRLPILWEYFVEKGIIFVNDVMDLNGNIYSYKTFCELFGKLCSEFRYYQLVAAIPLVWRKKVKKAKRKLLVCKPLIKNYLWLKGKKINPFMYKFFLRAYNLNKEPDKFQSYWEGIFDIPLP
ncbi:reverse transcriptase domain-containing protein, partial [Candidatus Ichthyocystis sparus]|uniref:reverse transcriptase domain-containing protein n=1 Tax=Candidatus Ichthyocystis sparus TaxID=1561004 RepID=UPI00159EBF08